MKDKVNVHVSFPWAAVLFVIFLTLKLAGVITWSWWWVTAPLWIPIVIALTMLTCVGLFVLIVALLND